jgi:hypothetical protein
MAIKQLSDGNPDGTTVGQGPTDKISFHGSTPIVQQVLAAAPTATQISTVLAALGLTRTS